MTFYKNRIQSRTLHLWETKPYEKSEPKEKFDLRSWKYVNNYIYVDNTSVVLFKSVFLQYWKALSKNLTRTITLDVRKNLTPKNRTSRYLFIKLLAFSESLTKTKVKLHWTLISLTSAVICKQNFLHGIEIVQYLWN